jgi:lipoate-protein ligase B
MKIQWLGTKPFQEVLNIQLELRSEVEKDSTRSTILGLEHSPVVTMGARGQNNDLHQSEENLRSLGWDVQRTDRGGQTTLHNPGQLVVYPILDVRGLGVRNYVCLLAQATRKLLQDFNIEAQYDEESPGLYTQNGKIAFFGIRIVKGISYHGLSLNVKNNLKDFEMIVSCGQTQARFDRIENYVTIASCQNLFEKWSAYFLELYSKENSPELTPCSFEYRSKDQ